MCIRDRSRVCMSHDNVWTHQPNFVKLLPYRIQLFVRLIPPKIGVGQNNEKIEKAMWGIKLQGILPKI